jgi:hypothetical protein
LRVDKAGQRWAMTNGDDVPEHALLPIARKNIRICGFHSNKRIFSTLTDLLLRDWSTMQKKTTKKGVMETEKQLEARKTEKALEWQLFAGKEYRLGDQYTIPLQGKDDIPAPIKLDGANVRLMLQNRAWEKGLEIIDQRPDTKAVWEVTLQKIST